MDNILLKRIDEIMNNKLKLRKQKSILLKQENEENSKLANIENALNITIKTCEYCSGSGESDKIENTIHKTKCLECKGLGYIISKRT